MGYKLYMLLIFAGTMTPIWAAFKDFVIENENDLERFGLSNGDMMYDDVDLESQLLNDEIYDDEAYSALGSSCGGYGGMSSSIYDMFQSYDEDYDGGGSMMMPGFEGKIDKNILREIIRQLANDPRFQHLKDHLTEDKLLLAYHGDDNNENLPTQDYVDYFEEDHNYFYNYE